MKGNSRVIRSYQEARNSSLYGSQQKLDFILMYMKENPNQAYHGRLFGICQSKVSEWVNFLAPVLEASLKRLGVMPQTGYSYQHQEVAEYLLVDVTERQVPRCLDHACQKETYSGKKKLHTIKNLAITAHNGHILYISPSYEGSIHDKTIWDGTAVGHTALNMLFDLGFLGVDKAYPNAVLPYKKPKNRELTELQKDINRAISKLRVGIEHTFASVKRLKIIGHKIRLKTNGIRDTMIRIAAALHNLRLIARTP